jgi:hypothetical protein
MWNSFVKIQHTEINHNRTGNLYKNITLQQHLQNYCAFTDVRKTGANGTSGKFLIHINNQSYIQSQSVPAHGRFHFVLSHILLTIFTEQTEFPWINPSTSPPHCAGFLLQHTCLYFLFATYSLCSNTSC